jgi:hypothetical protein
MSHRQADLATLRRQLFDAENAIVDLNRRLTEAIIWKRAPGSLSRERDAAVEARDFMRASLKRLEGETHG